MKIYLQRSETLPWLHKLHIIFLIVFNVLQLSVYFEGSEGFEGQGISCLQLYGNWVKQAL